jgi:xanthine dehydrogenase accessory factor
MEAKAIDAVASLAPNDARFLDLDLTPADADGLGMICGGRMRVYLERLDAQDKPALTILCAKLRAGESRTWATVLKEGASAWQRVSTGTLEDHGGDMLKTAMADGMNPKDADHLFASLDADERAPVIRSRGLWRVLLEPIRPAERLYIFGAGHVGAETARLAAGVGFRVTLVDEREEFARPDAVPGVEVLRSRFDSGWESLGPNTYAVIVTRGHVHDTVVLRQLLRASPAYIGMIGSRAKREAAYARLEAEGFPRRVLEEIKCPVGIAIKAQTPAEIAVSIVAQLILERAARRGAP